MAAIIVKHSVDLRAKGFTGELSGRGESEELVIWDRKPQDSCEISGIGEGWISVFARSHEESG